MQNKANLMLLKDATSILSQGKLNTLLINKEKQTLQNSDYLRIQN